jgi:hypothetical protein
MSDTKFHTRTTTFFTIRLIMSLSHIVLTLSTRFTQVTPSSFVQCYQTGALLAVCFLGILFYLEGGGSTFFVCIRLHGVTCILRV